MHARVARFENRDTSRVGELVSLVRGRMEAGGGPPAAQGFLMLIDRGSGRSIGLSLFPDEEAIRRAEPEFERMGDDISEDLRGRRTSVETYEVAMHEGGGSARAARVSSLEGPADRIDEGIDKARSDVLPRARQMAGWDGFLYLVDRGSGRQLLITLWESEEALRASEEQASRLREETAAAGGETITGVERYEIAMAQLPS